MVKDHDTLRSLLLGGQDQLDRYRRKSDPTALAVVERKKMSSNTNPQTCTMHLHTAYESLEQMRRFNLQVTCRERGICCTPVDLDCTCRTCLLAANKAHMPGSTMKNRKAKLTKMNPVARLFRRNVTQCLTCGNQVCSHHSSKPFRKEELTICQDCESVFTVDFVVDCLTSSDPKVHIDHLVELYDRVVISLKYHYCDIKDVGDDENESLRNIDSIDKVATQVEETQCMATKVSLASSSVNVLSGVLGVAAASLGGGGVIGVPLLVASLVCGGSAAAVKTGHDMHDRSLPHQKRAHRILALHGMVRAILGVVGTLRDALTRDCIRTELYVMDDNNNVGDALSTARTHNNTRDPLTPASLQLKKPLLVGGVTAGKAGIELSVLADGAQQFTDGARLLSKTAMDTFCVAGGALSAATIMMEARAISITLKNLRESKHCEQAHALLHIRHDLLHIPSTKGLASECEGYLETMEQRQRLWTEQEAVQLLLETFSSEEKKDDQPFMRPCSETDEDSTALFTEDDENTEHSEFDSVLLRESSFVHHEVPTPSPVAAFRSQTCLSTAAQEQLSDSLPLLCDDDCSSVHSSATTSTIKSLLERITIHKQHQASNSSISVSSDVNRDKE